MISRKLQSRRIGGVFSQPYSTIQSNAPTKRKNDSSLNSASLKKIRKRAKKSIKNPSIVEDIPLKKGSKKRAKKRSKKRPKKRRKSRPKKKASKKRPKKKVGKKRRRKAAKKPSKKKPKKRLPKKRKKKTSKKPKTIFG